MILLEYHSLFTSPALSPTIPSPHPHPYLLPFLHPQPVVQIYQTTSFEWAIASLWHPTAFLWAPIHPWGAEMSVNWPSCHYLLDVIRCCVGGFMAPPCMLCQRIISLCDLPLCLPRSWRARTLPLFSLFSVLSTMVSANVWIYSSLFINDKETLKLCDWPRDTELVTQVSLLTLRQLFLEEGKITGKVIQTRGEERKKKTL